MKTVWKWLLWAVFVMVGLPFLAVELVPGDAGMAVCFVLFFAVNPLFSIWAGWGSGGDGRAAFWVPMAVAGLFLVGVWAFFDLGETAFLRYAAGYLCLGWIGMGAGRLLGKK